ncbi:MAG: diadenylate cyclase CdaA [Prevotellaceae bacterium]|jgi:uncharacterized protein (TIGR00159 family)|nr:diadenylate cyclase CdaA [Prevotellaceae bacterium]
MDFIHLNFVDILDILMVAFILYQIYRVIRGTAAMNIFVAVILFYVLYLVVKAFKMELTSMILGQFIGVGVIALIILFQQEIRRFLLHIGTRYMRRSKKPFIKWFFDETVNVNSRDFSAIVEACRSMSETKTGALIVVGRKSSMDLFSETGDIINAALNYRLLLNIFFKNAPLHDGAVIVINGRIHAARCMLPSSANPNLPASFGMRHRAAIGITEETDAIAIVVSEETGKISTSEAGQIENDISIERLESILRTQ